MPSWNKGKSKVLDWLKAQVAHQGNDCLTWPFALVRGYGHFKYKDKTTYAHRVMCELAHGAPPTPLHFAAHSCGNGHCGCVNPHHVSWKTQSENEFDKRDHGTWNAGAGRYKLTPASVARIRALKGKKTQDELAKMFGVSRRNIGAVLSRKTWPNGIREPKGFAVKPYRGKSHSGQSTTTEK